MTDYLEDARDALAMVRLAQSGDDDTLDDHLNVIIGDRGEDAIFSLMWMLASLTATLASEWRRSLLQSLPEAYHPYVPTEEQLVEDMQRSLLRREVEEINA